MSADEGFGERLAMAIRRRGWEQKDLAERLEITPQTISHWVKGRRGENVRFLVRLLKQLGVNAHWLLTGEGPMSPPNDGLLHIAPERMDQFSEELLELVDRLRADSSTHQP